MEVYSYKPHWDVNSTINNMVLRDNRFIMIREIEVLPAWRHDVGLKLTWNRALKSLSWSWNSHFSHVIWGKMSFAIAMLTLYFFEFYFRSLWMTSSNGDIFRVIGPLRGELIHRSAVTRSFGVFCDLRLRNRLNKQSKHRWIETPSRSLWRHSNVYRNCAPRWSLMSWRRKYTGHQ